MPERRLPSSANTPGNGATRPAPKAWGVGRVAFFARIDAIRAELAQGWPLTAIYARHKDALGISYSGFWRLVVRHAADARPTQSQTLKSGPKRPPQASAPAAITHTGTACLPAPLPQQSEGPDAHAGRQPARTFNHDPIERPGDYERLFGTRKR